MNKKTKLWLGVGVVAAAAYYFWNKSKTAPATAPAATVAKFVGSDGVFVNGSGGCPSGYSYSINSNKVAVCDNGKGHRYRTNIQ